MQKPARRGGRRTGVQYTVRDVPSHIDAALRRKAREERKSLNQLLRDALSKEAGSDASALALHHDLDHLAGRWDEDPEFDRVIAAQDQVDEAMWR